MSLVEACYLSSRGMIEVRDASGDVFDTAALRRLGRTTQEGFGYRLKAYRDLRDRGLLIKAGFKYGTHFRLYERDPDECHAKYLAHAVPADTSAVWPEISRIVRLSGGVRKEILFCRVGEDVEYLSFKWFRPRSPVGLQDEGEVREETVPAAPAYLEISLEPDGHRTQAGPSVIPSVLLDQRAEHLPAPSAFAEPPGGGGFKVLSMVRQEERAVEVQVGHGGPEGRWEHGVDPLQFVREPRVPGTDQAESEVPFLHIAYPVPQVYGTGRGGPLVPKHISGVHRLHFLAVTVVHAALYTVAERRVASRRQYRAHQSWMSIPSFSVSSL